ncbi:UNKNOWN [Stylonychia lemnae]|uniref:Uncharacterized protein n=1 Tax=Stylonychia lemnae TaxID=5949 RepID=A0A078APC2_STYLE|nr:UNKNOWN [Stylonychia lemnae]|eukprot:CDW83791.1 UNKNOWN [Stylonychia lemnae]
MDGLMLKEPKSNLFYQIFKLARVKYNINIILFYKGANQLLNAQNARPPMLLNALNVMIQLIKSLLRLEIQNILVVYSISQTLLEPQTSSSLSSISNCHIYNYYDQYNCLVCLSGFYLSKNGYFNISANRYQDICQPNVQTDLCLQSRSEFVCDTCIYGYNTIQIGDKKSCHKCNQQNGAQIKTLRCEFEIEQSTSNVIQKKITSCLGGFVDLQTGECVSSCGVGRYGNVTLGYSGMIEQTLCLDCDSSCYECSSQKTQCLSCKEEFYLDSLTKTCKQKNGLLETTIYVQSKDFSNDYTPNGITLQVSQYIDLAVC